MSQHHLKWLYNFCSSNGLKLSLSKHVRVGREAHGIGIASNDAFLTYNPLVSLDKAWGGDYELLYDDRWENISPNNRAKFDCLAVIGDDTRSLYKWCKKIDRIGFKIKPYKTKAVGAGLIFHGLTNDVIILES